MGNPTRSVIAQFVIIALIITIGCICLHFASIKVHGSETKASRPFPDSEEETVANIMAAVNHYQWQIDVATSFAMSADAETNSRLAAGLNMAAAMHLRRSIWTPDAPAWAKQYRETNSGPPDESDTP